MLRTAIDEYIARLETSPLPDKDRPARRRTVLTYRSSINRFAAWLGADATLAEFNTSMLTQYKLLLVKQRVHPNTIRARYNAIRSFGAWLEEVGMLPRNPASAVKLPRKVDGERYVPTDTEVNELLAACGRLMPERRSILARAIMSALVYSGIRRSELLGLKVGDVEFCRTGARLYVRDAKGGVSFTANVGTECAEKLRMWLKYRDMEQKRGEWRSRPCAHGYVWDYDHSRRLGDNGLRTLIREINQAADRDGHDTITPHCIRHNYAERVLRAPGSSIQMVQAALHHRRPATTLEYLRHNHAQVTAVVNAIAPELGVASAMGATGPATPWRKRLLNRGAG